MRMIVIGLVTAVAALAVSAAPGNAQNRRWCTEGHVGSWGFPNCAYDTYAQCAATASGTGKHCTENYQYRSERKAPRKGDRRSRRNRED